MSEFKANLISLYSVQQAFKEHILSANLFKPSDNLLVALSGGIDSVVLVHLLVNTGFNVTLAHCNFKLRKAASDFDEDFCLDLAKRLGLKIYTKTMDVKAHQARTGTSVQMAARELRYGWFKSLLDKHNFNYLLTAHHGNDVIETIFINLIRGTGISGLKGIPEKSTQIVRPLLHFTKENIIAYATENNIAFRLDSSNLEDKYARNFLRLNILPAFKKLHPQVEQTLLNNVSNFKEEAAIVEDFLKAQAAKIVSEKSGLFFLDKMKLSGSKYVSSVLHYLISPFGFNATQIKNIRQHLAVKGLVGKIFNSATHTITIDRTHLVVKQNSSSEKINETFTSLQSFKKNTHLKVTRLTTFALPASTEMLVEENRLVFPLTIRARITGDKFRPFGMKGFKLLSDFFKEQKLNSFDKENCKLLVNGNGEIIWVIGYRSDERYRVKNKESELIKLSIID